MQYTTPNSIWVKKFAKLHLSLYQNDRECLHGPSAPQHGMLGALIVWWSASFWLQWTVAEGTVRDGSPAKFPTKPTEAKMENVRYLKQIKICAEYRVMHSRLPLFLLSFPCFHRPVSFLV